MTQRTKYEPSELRVMEQMAHGHTREEISKRLHMSPSKVARLARSATDKAAGEPGVAIVYGIAVLVAQGRISVRFGHQESTAYKTALAWLNMRIHSCVTLREFQELREAFTAMQTEGETHGN